MIRIVIVSETEQEQKIIFNQLSSMEDFFIAAVGKDGYDALTAAAKQQPDIIIMDMRLPDIDGLELAAIIKRRYPAIALIALGLREDGGYIGRAIQAGISGCLLKTRDIDKLANSVRTVFHGGYYINAAIVSRAVRTFLDKDHFGPIAVPASDSGKNVILPKFSAMERRIITGIAQGQSDKEIADDLHIAAGTVRNQLAVAKNKTGLCNRIQIAICALIFGLINFTQIKNAILERLQGRKYHGMKQRA
jgi:two-component system nitrate/nitrite response regulator NarL